ncbi:hypothetical protein ED733_007718 [Metarhizium rileyi]|uniref:Uncharacterized protein n=1 Tax=Metarhizium rileyi (strain RCEF 4871) TaxID=1649241 RepID=A0A5C6GMJ5_METRR|nr:hypothetical protein ED733_007718 [Metarhizium rileyi]
MEQTRPVPKHDVKAVPKYFKENEDGSPPHPTYVDRPETNNRPFEAHQVLVTDIAGEASYYTETEQLLKDVPLGQTAAKPFRGPVQRVHIDQSYSAALSRVPHHLPDEAEHLLKCRVRIINVWRPIKKIERDPLAVAEAGSVPDADLIVTELVYPDK